MRISNVGMFVKDLERAKDFFVEYFHATVHCQYQEDNGFKEYILKFDEGPKLEIMTKPEIVDEKKNINRTGFIHICFKVDSLDQLNDITEKFRSAGYQILYEPKTVGGKETRAIAFEDNILEVSA